MQLDIKLRKGYGKSVSIHHTYMRKTLSTAAAMGVTKATKYKMKNANKDKPKEKI